MNKDQFSLQEKWRIYNSCFYLWELILIAVYSSTDMSIASPYKSISIITLFSRWNIIAKTKEFRVHNKIYFLRGSMEELQTQKFFLD